MPKNPQISVILPCRNESQAIRKCIQTINTTLKNHSYEIIVSDSSTDGSDKIAQKLGAKVIKHDKVGYGIALREGIVKANGKYVFMADADMTYDFSEIPKFIHYLEQGYDFVIGNCFSGRMHKNAMPFLNRYIGNPILSAIQRVFFGNNIKDSHCGMRAFTKKAYDSLNLNTTGMEFASEMIVKAVKKNLKIKQIPIAYHPRIGESKLNPFLDGWRHIRFMLLYSPKHIFLIPGIFLFLLGSISMIYMYPFTEKFTHPMFISSILTILGFQIISFGIFAKIYVTYKLKEFDSKLDSFVRKFSLEKAILIGLITGAIGFLLFSLILLKWINEGFGSLNLIKQGIVATTIVVIALQIIFNAFMLSTLGIE